VRALLVRADRRTNGTMGTKKLIHTFLDYKNALKNTEFHNRYMIYCIIKTNFLLSILILSTFFCLFV